MRRLAVPVLILATALVWGCEHAPAGPGYVGTSLAALQPASSCDDVLLRLKQKTQHDMETTLQSNLQQALQLVSYGCNYWGGGEDGAYGANGAPTPATTAGQTSHSSGDPSTPNAYSTTNNQVVGVDEADFIKNDGAYIYVVAHGKLRILDAWPATEMHTIGSAAVEGTPTLLFVQKDKALVYSQLGALDGSGATSSGYTQSTCTYGYDCDFTGDGQILKVTVFDISDRTNPVVTRELVFSGSYLNSRRIDDIVHTVVIFPEVSVPGLVLWPDALSNYWSLCGANGAFPFSADQIVDMFVDLWQKNSTAIATASITEWIPGIKDTRHTAAGDVTQESLLADCQNFYVSQAGDGRSFLSLVSLDMTALDPVAVTTIVGKPGAMYATAQSLYIGDRHYSSDMTSWYYQPAEAVTEATTVHKFQLTTGSTATAYVGSGVVKGRVLNQFSMDENDGYLRIATTTSEPPDPLCHSTMSVLAQGQGELNVVGELDQIAVTEDIRSARFEGNLGFLVTFKKTDPLFVLDLSDPTHPVIKGQLQIPGFSTYMHMMDDTHILAIGFDANDMGSYAWFAGIQLQIFDVTDVTSPQLLYREVIGTRGTSSDATTNHLAFNYFKTENLLALPMVKCLGGSGGTYGDELVFDGLMVYSVTLDGGFSYLGGIPQLPPQQNTPYGTTCDLWWADSSSDVKRSIIADQFVYSVADDGIKVSNLADLANPVATTDLTQ